MGVAAKALHGAKVCLIPKPENNYRPLVLRRGPLMVASGLIVSAKVLAIGLALILPSTAELSTITSARILQLTNNERVESGLGVLKENASLTKAAAGKAKDIIDNDYFAHISPTGVTPWFWIQQQGYSYSVAGENLAIDFVQAEDVVSAWMASPGHRENILQGDYTETGVAVLTGEYQGGTSTIVVHMFGLPRGDIRPSQSSLSARPPIPAPTVSMAPSKSPVPTIVPEVVKEPPAVPEIKLWGTEDVFRDIVGIIVSGDVGSTIKIRVNNKDVGTVKVIEGGYLRHEVDLASFDDGKLNISAYALNDDGIRSEEAKAIEIKKDTAGPDISEEELLFVVSPATDFPYVLMFVPDGEYDELLIEREGVKLLSVTTPLPNSINFEITSEPVDVKVFDELGNLGVVGKADLLPAIFSGRDVNFKTKATKFNAASRRLVMSVGLVWFVMLLIAVLIKIKVQRPQMIVFTSLVILLALVLLFI